MTAAGASCDVIPSAREAFRSSLGVLSQPFASPADPLELQLDARCHGALAPAGFPSDRQAVLVTIVFKAASGARRAVVLSPVGCSPSQVPGLAERLATCTNQLGNAQPVGLPAPVPASCVDASTRPSLDVVDRRTLRFLFPDTDSRHGVGGDDRTFAGPATIAVTPIGSPLPCDLAAKACPGTSGPLACVDRLFASDGTCEQTPEGTFPHFTALPPPNDYREICTEPMEVCRGNVSSELLAAVDQEGNLLIPMDWGGILVDQEVPVPRLLEGTTTVDAFPDRPGVPILIPDGSALGSFSVEGVRLPPVFEPQLNPEERSEPRLFGSADAPRTVLRIDRRAGVTRQCRSGPLALLGRPCVDEVDCGGGACGARTCFEGSAPLATECTSDAQCETRQECGPSSFDFVSRLDDAAGPMVFDQIRLAARDPVPLDGLAQTEQLNAFVLEESISGKDLNGDLDVADHVATLGDRMTGATQDIGRANGFDENGVPLAGCGLAAAAQGRAVPRVRDGRFSFPARTGEGDVLALLESEVDSNACDQNGDLDRTDYVLRVFRRGVGEIQPAAGPLRAVDLDPKVDGRSMSISEGKVFFRTSEPGMALQTTEEMSPDDAAADRLGGTDTSAASADGRFVAFLSASSNLVPNDGNGAIDVFVLDRKLGTLERVSVHSDGTEADGDSTQVAISADARFVTFTSLAGNLVDADTNTVCSAFPFCKDVFVRDRCASRGLVVLGCTPTTERVSVSSAGVEADDSSQNPSISAGGRFVAFDSLARNLSPLDENDNDDVYLHDRLLGTTVLASVSSNAIPADQTVFSSRPSISPDGRFVAFQSRLGIGLGGTTVFSQIYLFDSQTRTSELVSATPTGEPGNQHSFQPVVSEGGSFVAFRTLATNLVTARERFGVGIMVWSRATGECEQVSLGAELGRAVRLNDGVSTVITGSPTSISANGRFVAFGVASDGRGFELDEDPLCPNSGGGYHTGVVFDRLTGLARGVVAGCSVFTGGVFDPAFAIPDALAVRPAISSDGSNVLFQVPATDDTMPVPVLLAGPDVDDPLGVDDSVLPNGSFDGAVLEVFDTASMSLTTLCRAEQVSTAGGRAAFLRPETAAGAGACAGGPRNGDGDTDDLVVSLWRGGGVVDDLGHAATRVKLSEEVLAALVSERGDGEDWNDDDDMRDTVVWVYDVARSRWQNTMLAADEIAVGGRTVAFTVPEKAQGKKRLNQDKDKKDRVLHVCHIPEAGGDCTVFNTEHAAEDFVVGATGLVAFRTSEKSDGKKDLNKDGDKGDDVLFVYDPVAGQLICTEQTVRPCALEACDPSVPYRVQDATVKFLSFEPDEGCSEGPDCIDGARDLDGDGTSRELVLRVFNAMRACHTGSIDGTNHALAGAAAGICTTDGEACADDDDCAPGRCFVPPGGCILDRGTTCDPEAIPSAPGLVPAKGTCQAGEFCEPLEGQGGLGRCKQVQVFCEGGPMDSLPCTEDDECTPGFCRRSCQSNMDCRSGAICVDGNESTNLIVAPLGGDDAMADERPGDGRFVGTGRCVEETARPCTDKNECGPGELCGDAGTCDIPRGACGCDRTVDGECADDACPAGATCRKELVAQTLNDSDGDELPKGIDNCPDVFNPVQSDLDGDGIGDDCDAQTCGDGVPQSGEPCDDHNRIGNDGCDCERRVCESRTAATATRLTVKKIGGTLGNESLFLKGRLPLGGADPAVVLARGAQVLIEDAGKGGRAAFDVSLRTFPIPPAGPGCDPNDGWSTATPGVWRYKNVSGRLPAAGCAPGSAGGLRSLKLTDRRLIDGSVAFEVRTKKSPFQSVVGPLRATVVLGAGFVESVLGPCAVAEFGADDCKTNRNGKLTCR